MAKIKVSEKRFNELNEVLNTIGKEEARFLHDKFSADGEWNEVMECLKDFPRVLMRRALYHGYEIK